MKSTEMQKLVLMLTNGEKLDENEISILRSLSEKAELEKNKMIIFFNIGISAEKVKQKIDKFGDMFYLYDAQNITFKKMRLMHLYLTIEN